MTKQEQLILIREHLNLVDYPSWGALEDAVKMGHFTDHLDVSSTYAVDIEPLCVVNGEIFVINVVAEVLANELDNAVMHYQIISPRLYMDGTVEEFLNGEGETPYLIKLSAIECIMNIREDLREDLYLKEQEILKLTSQWADIKKDIIKFDNL